MPSGFFFRQSFLARRQDMFVAKLKMLTGRSFLRIAMFERVITIVLASPMKLSTLCLSFFLLACQGQAFQHLPSSKERLLGIPSVSRTASRIWQAKRSFDSEEEEYTGVPQLPAFGASSFSNSHVNFSTGMPSSLPYDPADAAFVSPKFKLQYTCNICETRNSHMVSRLGKKKWLNVHVKSMGLQYSQRCNKLYAITKM